jgi:hypothetical protein
MGCDVGADIGSTVGNVTGTGIGTSTGTGIGIGRGTGASAGIGRVNFLRSCQIVGSDCGCWGCSSGTGSATSVEDCVSGTLFDTNSEPSGKAADTSSKRRPSCLLICWKTCGFPLRKSDIMFDGERSERSLASATSWILLDTPLTATAIIRYTVNRIMVVTPTTLVARVMSPSLLYDA